MAALSQKADHFAQKEPFKTWKTENYRPMQQKNRQK
jgi:hypothetical protein